MDKKKARSLRLAALALLGLLLLVPTGCSRDDESGREPPPPEYRHDGYPNRDGKRIYRGKIEVPDGQVQDGRRIHRGRIDAPDGRRMPPPRIDPRTGKPIPPPRIDPKTGKPLPPPQRR